jgi:hypothetical protein
MEEPKIIYSSYTEAQKRATAKYREANKEKVNAQRKKYYESRKEKDPDFLQYKRDKAREYYLKKKHSKIDIQEEIKDGDNIELVKVSIEEPEEPESEETIEEHWLKKSQARDFIPDVPDEICERKSRRNVEIVEPEEEKPPLAWSNAEIVEDVKPEKKQRKPRAKPNLKLEDLQQLLTPSEDLSTSGVQVHCVPKTPKSRKSKKEIKDILLSA